MIKNFDLTNDGLNDWEPVVAFVRGLLENTEDGSCWKRTREYVLRDNSLLSQTLIQKLGQMADPRGIPIVEDKLEFIDSINLTQVSPWEKERRFFEILCFEALAQIGGNGITDLISAYKLDISKDYLHDSLSELKLRDSQRKSVSQKPNDFPQVLTGIRSIHDVLGHGSCKRKYSNEQSREIIEAWQGLKWPGSIEYLSGDGKNNTFELKNKITDHIHDFADPFSDFGIFMSTPKIEYPLTNRRWADSHTFLNYQIQDSSLYGQQYTWDIKQNTITTHFHEHVPIEKVVVNDDKKSITVKKAPISTGVELRGNCLSKKCNSAVRGVWDNPEKKGRNYYVKRANVITSPKKLIYFKPNHSPVVNQLGIWLVDEKENPYSYFDSDGLCKDQQAVIRELLIPLNAPKILSWTNERYNINDLVASGISHIPTKMRCDLASVPSIDTAMRHLGVKFDEQYCGQLAIWANNENGYKNGLDINSDGVIDESEVELLSLHQGYIYRMNLADYGYFGFDWLSTGQRAMSRTNQIDEPMIFVCAYDYGAGYDSDTGIVDLFEEFPVGKTLYVEYYYDKPPIEGDSNIKVYLHEVL